MNIFYFNPRFPLSIITCLLGILLLPPQLAKSQGINSSIEVRVISLYTNAGGGDGSPNYEYKWVLKYTTTHFNSDNFNTDWNNVSSSCFEKDAPNGGWFDFNRVLYLNSYNVLPEKFQLFIEGYERDAGEGCYYHHGRDGNHGLVHSPIFNLKDYAPGVWSNPITFSKDNGTLYAAKIQIRYTLPPPTSPTATYGGSTNYMGNICADQTVMLNTSTNLPNKSGLRYHWEYNIAGETELVPNPEYTSCIDNCQQIAEEHNYYWCMDMICPNYPATLSQPVWRTLNATTENISFIPANTLFPSGLLNNTAVNFRVRAESADLVSSFSSPTTLQFSPASPSLTSPITVEASCSESPTGIIHVTGVKSQFSQYRYLLKTGIVETLGCDPDKPGDCFLGGNFSGEASDSLFDIPDRAAGTYTLFLLNNGGTNGFCTRKVGTVIVPVIPKLEATISPPVNLSCHGVNKGGISVSIAGGRPSNVTYKLENTTTGTIDNQSSTTANASVVWNQLNPGTYQLTVNDGCTPPIPLFFDITQPAKIRSEEFQKTAATCTQPANGSASIRVSRSSGTFDRSVSTPLQLLHYQLWKEGALYRETESSELTNTWIDLPVSNAYQLRVKEKGGLDCNGVTVDFAIAGPVPLGINPPLVTNVTCFSGNNGSITVTGTGGTGSYVYALSGAVTVTNNSGVFTDLRAGNYTITVSNTVSNTFTCQDNYVHQVTIQQPTPVRAVLSKKDISCDGRQDGEVQATVTGGKVGSVGYVYTWETRIGNAWIAMSAQASRLTGLSTGDFRLRVQDESGCPTLSNEVTIQEPAPLGISSVQATDIQCYGGKGNIGVAATGGTGAYVWAYSLNNSATFTPFEATTPLDPGTYTIRVSDANQCTYEHPEKYVLTAPASALSFTETLSDYQGYQISCFGGNNGSATLIASGGNGANYAGYTYALDNGPFQTEATLTGINAGLHTLRVKDARGCIVAKAINFTQALQPLVPVLVENKPVVCFGDATGVLEWTATGGLAPYRYRLDEQPFQALGRFTGLGAAEYTLTIQDRNGCEQTIKEKIRSLNPPIEIASLLTGVSCRDGQDGAMATFVTGGVPPFQYRWNDMSATTPTVSGLKSGTYTVTITDKAGCSRQASGFVPQPQQALQASIATIPVCYGQSKGSMTVTTRGGTRPYAYSLDNGQTYQTDSVFRAPVGTYQLTCRDSKGCLITTPAKIVLSNDQPEPNFLVATQRNALDTLAILEVSVPKPDSIHWRFDPRAMVIRSDPWSPKLRFPEAGTYVVGMTGYFGGCAYEIAKTLTVNPYDPLAAQEKLPGYRPIVSVSLTPNPTSGELEVSVQLNKKYALSLVVYDVLGTKHYEQTWASIQELKQRMLLDKAPTGVYLLRVITEFDAQEVRFLIQK